MHANTVYRVIFALLQMVSTRLEFAQTKLWTKRDNLDVGIHPVSTLPADTRAKGVKTKGGIFFLYTVYV